MKNFFFLTMTSVCIMNVTLAQTPDLGDYTDSRLSAQEEYDRELRQKESNDRQVKEIQAKMREERSRSKYYCYTNMFVNGFATTYGQTENEARKKAKKAASDRKYSSYKESDTFCGRIY